MGIHLRICFWILLPAVIKLLNARVIALRTERVVYFIINIYVKYRTKKRNICAVVFWINASFLPGKEIITETELLVWTELLFETDNLSFYSLPIKILCFSNTLWHYRLPLSAWNPYLRDNLEEQILMTFHLFISLRCENWKDKFINDLMLEQLITLIYENINQGPIMAFKKKSCFLNCLWPRRNKWKCKSLGRKDTLISSKGWFIRCTFCNSFP